MANILALITTAIAALTAPASALPVSAAPSPVISTPEPGATPWTGPTSLRANSGTASWYIPRPSACWDAQGRHPFPTGPDGMPISAYTAHPSLNCGTLIQVNGPLGSITVPVEDHGPESWTGRALDLSPAAFRAVAGSLSVGVVPVAWRPAA